MIVASALVAGGIASGLATGGHLGTSGGIAADIARHCLPCHGATGTAPIKLDSPEALRRHRTLAAMLVADGTMPPSVNLAANAAIARTLSSAERARIIAALEGGSPVEVVAARDDTRTDAGARARAWIPPAEARIQSAEARIFPAQAWTAPARGGARLRTFTAATAARKVRGIRWADPAELAQSPIRFASFAVDTRGVMRRLEAASGESGGVESMGNVGTTPSGALGALSRVAPVLMLPAGFHFDVPAGDLVMEVLAEPIGRPADVLPRIAWIDAAETDARPVRALALPAASLALEPGECTTRRLTHVAQGDLDIVAVIVKGGSFLRSARVTAGAAITDIPDFRMAFNEPFVLRNPHRVTAGSAIVAELGFDNTTDNPQQPIDPPLPVQAGLPPFGEDAIVVVLYANAASSR
jgi:mono/diheme cytochrome c family protein